MNIFLSKVIQVSSTWYVARAILGEEVYDESKSICMI